MPKRTTNEMQAYEALGDLIAMATTTHPYKDGEQWAVSAMVWARFERDRLSQIIRRCADVSHTEG